MKTHRLELFADYFQFYLQDEESEGNLSNAWSEDAVIRMMAVTAGTVGIGTVRNMTVPVTLEFLDAEPRVDLAEFDHVVEGAIDVPSGRLVVAGCTDFFADAPRFDLPPGTYKVRLSGSGFDTLSEDGLEGRDHYLVQLWSDSFVEPKVLKQHAG
ncbi:hypothetical protein VLK31_21205 [Variovorax sp. H27-G14]|uniref:hypothetical protein n=1 Tax=Variovorax sp. H27-G14 TaxID=3111914 RepID=UPI0038FC4906